MSDRRALHERIAISLGWLKREADYDPWDSPDGNVHDYVPDYDTDETANAMLRTALLERLGWNKFADAMHYQYLSLKHDEGLDAGAAWREAVVNVYCQLKGITAPERSKT